MPAHARSCRRRCKAKIVFLPAVMGKKRRIELRFYFFPGGREPGPSADLRARLRISISRGPERPPMRPETERNIADIQQAIALLRRHL